MGDKKLRKLNIEINLGKMMRSNYYCQVIFLP